MSWNTVLVARNHINLDHWEKGEYRKDLIALYSVLRIPSTVNNVWTLMFRPLLGPMFEIE